MSNNQNIGYFPNNRRVRENANYYAPHQRYANSHNRGYNYTSSINNRDRFIPLQPARFGQRPFQAGPHSQPFMIPHQNRFPSNRFPIFRGILSERGRQNYQGRVLEVTNPQRQRTIPSYFRSFDDLANEEYRRRMNGQLGIPTFPLADAAESSSSESETINVGDNLLGMGNLVFAQNTDNIPLMDIEDGDDTETLGNFIYTFDEFLKSDWLTKFPLSEQDKHKIAAKYSAKKGVGNDRKDRIKFLGKTLEFNENVWQLSVMGLDLEASADVDTDRIVNVAKEAHFINTFFGKTKTALVADFLVSRMGGSALTHGQVLTVPQRMMALILIHLIVSAEATDNDYKYKQKILRPFSTVFSTDNLVENFRNLVASLKNRANRQKLCWMRLLWKSCILDETLEMIDHKYFWLSKGVQDSCNALPSHLNLKRKSVPFVPADDGDDDVYIVEQINKAEPSVVLQLSDEDSFMEQDNEEVEILNNADIPSREVPPSPNHNITNNYLGASAITNVINGTPVRRLNISRPEVIVNVPLVDDSVIVLSSDDEQQSDDINRRVTEVIDVSEDSSDIVIITQSAEEGDKRNIDRKQNLDDTEIVFADNHPVTRTTRRTSRLRSIAALETNKEIVDENANNHQTQLATLEPSKDLPTRKTMTSFDTPNPTAVPARRGRPKTKAVETDKNIDTPEISADIMLLTNQRKKWSKESFAGASKDKKFENIIKKQLKPKKSKIDETSTSWTMQIFEETVFDAYLPFSEGQLFKAAKNAIFLKKYLGESVVQPITQFLIQNMQEGFVSCDTVESKLLSRLVTFLIVHFIVVLEMNGGPFTANFQKDGSATVHRLIQDIGEENLKEAIKFLAFTWTPQGFIDIIPLGMKEMYKSFCSSEVSLISDIIKVISSSEGYQTKHSASESTVNETENKSNEQEHVETDEIPSKKKKTVTSTSTPSDQPLRRSSRIQKKINK